MMRWLYKLPLRLRSLFRTVRVEQELSEELRFHLEKLTEQNVSNGMTPEEGRYAALRELGGVEQIKEECRDMRRISYIETLLQDLRYGLRQLRRNPGFTAVAVITLALGIGANTAIFSLVDAVLLRPLPYREPQRLVQLWQTVPKKGDYEDGINYRNLIDWNRDNHSFEGMAAYRAIDVTLEGQDRPVVVPGAAVSAGLFRLLGVKPLVGRGFLRSEEKPGSSPVAILGEGIWRSKFDEDPHIVGKTIEVDQKPFVVVGVLPAHFRFPYQSFPTELWMPITDDPEISVLVMRRGPEFWQAIGRLKPHRTMRQAEDDLNLIATHLAEQFPQTNKGSGVRVVPLHTQLVENVKSALLVLFAAVSLVLLIACVNVGNLFLVRSISRTREIAVRAALGAGRGRIVRQLLSEAILLGLLGGSVGLLLASPVITGLVRLSPSNLPDIHRIGLDGWVLAFIVAISVSASLVFGLAPALVASRTDLQRTLKDGGRSPGDGKGRARLRAMLVTSEFALALVLLTGAGLMIRSLVRLTHIDLGFDPRHVLTAGISLPYPSFSNIQKQALLYGQILQHLRALPGVTEAGATTVLPLSGLFGVGFAIPGRSAEYTVSYSAASQGYFRAMAMPLIEGRPFVRQDNAKSPAVAIINRMFAYRYFPNANPLGQHLMLNGIEGKHQREIVGVVGDVKQTHVAGSAVPQVYVPYKQSPIPFWGEMSFVLRTPLKPEALAASVRKQIGALNSNVPLQHLQPMDAWVSASVSQPQFDAELFAIFAGLALTLAAIGIYGVTSYTVTQRTHEIGIRMALGAQRRNLLTLMLGQGMTLSALGVAAGLIAALGLTRFLSNLLYAVKPTDPLTFVAVSLILIGVALIACYIPARRATKVDPMVALRHE